MTDHLDEARERLTPQDAVNLGDQALLDAMRADPSETLLLAARAGQLDVARTAIDKGADLETEAYGNGTPLIEAAKRGDAEMGALLLDRGADMKACDAAAWDVEGYAAHGDRGDFMNMLIEHGMDVVPGRYEDREFTFEPMDRPPVLSQDELVQARELLSSIAAGDAERTQACFDKGAQLDDRWTVGGQDPIHHAVAHGNLNTLTVLAEHGVDVNTLDHEGRTPLSHAVDHPDREVRNQMVETLLDHQARGGLHQAIDKDEQVARTIIERSPEAVNETRLEHDEARGEFASLGTHTPALNHALREGKNDLARVMVEAGADVNAREQETQRTPLMRTTDPEMTKLLADRGADVNARDAQGQTPLHFSAMQGKTDTVKVLLDHRADPTIANAFDRTSESMAAEYGSLAMVSAMATARREQHAEQSQQRSVLGKTMDRLKSMGQSR